MAFHRFIALYLTSLITLPYTDETTPIDLPSTSNFSPTLNLPHTLGKLQLHYSALPDEMHGFSGSYYQTTSLHYLLCILKCPSM